MSHKKRINYPALGRPHSGFDSQQWNQLEKAFGKPIPKEVRDGVHTHVATWLYLLEKVGATNCRDVMKCLSKIEKAAKTLQDAMNELKKFEEDSINEVIPERFNSKGVTNVLTELARITKKEDDLFVADKIVPKHSYLIHWLYQEFDGNSLNPTVTRYNASRTHNPSPFVNFLAELGEIEPRLGLPKRDKNLKSLVSFSEWVYRKKGKYMFPIPKLFSIPK
ncbi:MAG: hypothetical protein ACSHXD_15110 [Marinosulfonomonas sp.]